MPSISCIYDSLGPAHILIFGASFGSQLYQVCHPSIKSLFFQAPPPLPLLPVYVTFNIPPTTHSPSSPAPSPTLPSPASSSRTSKGAPSQSTSPCRPSPRRSSSSRSRAARKTPSLPCAPPLRTPGLILRFCQSWWRLWRARRIC